ncbi:MAG: cation-translocating P-type ATPase [Caldilineaceae bacterium]
MFRKTRAALTEVATADSGPLWHTLTPQATVHTLSSDADSGLAVDEAARRLGEGGPNELVERDSRSPWLLLWQQLTAVMVLILIAAAVLSLVLGKYLEAGAIGAIVILFALLGFFQEYRAEKAIAALKKLAVPAVRVLRGGRLQEIAARDLVPGDVIVLEAGSVVPADARILTSANLRIQEAALTGESEAVEKTTGPLTLVDAPLGDRRNLAYMGTQVTYGRGTAIVVATGMNTELGRIATLLQDVGAEVTPLQQRLDSVGKWLALAGVVVALLILGGGLFVGESLGEMLLTAISVAVAVIPEGLPAVVTFTLAVGAQRMLRRNALIRKLPAVETLGSVTVIASDKTGTLTENRMTVTAIDAGGCRVDMIELLRHAAPPPAAIPDEVRTLLAAATLCNDAELSAGDPAGNSALQIIGDPTEGALVVAAARNKIAAAAVRSQYPRVAELPFDSDRKRMTTVHRVPGTSSAPQVLGPLVPPAPYLAITKGAVDGLLDLSTAIWRDGESLPMTSAARAEITATNDELAANGMRVLGVAFRPLAAPTVENVEQDLVFVGLVAMIDPPRPEVRAAVARCIAAGIRPIMITGDHPLTASYIARDLGIATDEQVLTGNDIDKFDQAELEAAAAKVSVFARVSPEHKLRLVEALQNQGHVVAMTGDGVNDAPALKKADIGVAMGITGTDVSKEAADMVLRDDNFSTIVAAVEEGRVIYDNLRRFVKFAVAGNIGKIAVMLFWPLLLYLFGLPLTEAVALLPLQLLWLNLLTDGLLGLSMGSEPAERNVMQRPPHSPQEGIFARGMGLQTAWVGALVGLLALAVGGAYYFQGLPQWQTMIFMTLAVLQIFQALATRSNTESLFAIGVFSNRVMWGAIAGVAALQFAAVYVPPLSSVFLRTVPLTAQDLGITVAAGLILFAAIELEKWILRRMRSARLQPGEASNRIEHLAA